MLWINNYYILYDLYNIKESSIHTCMIIDNELSCMENNLNHGVEACMENCMMIMFLILSVTTVTVMIKELVISRIIYKACIIL